MNAAVERWVLFAVIVRDEPFDLMGGGANFFLL